MSNEDDKKETPKTKILTELERFGFQIPECCRLGLDSCPHKANKEIKIKRNVGL